MKKRFFPGLLLLMASCHSAIKNEETATAVPADTVSAKATAAKALPIPAANQHKAVSAPEDLVGYWVGMFEPDIPQDSMDKQVVTYNEGYWNRANKITVVIDTVGSDGTVSGYSVDAGTQQVFKGTWKEANGRYELSMQEPGTNKYDGSFTMAIPKKDTLLIGKWKAFGKLSIPARSYELQKRWFKYDATIALDGSRFGDWEKYKVNHYKEEPVDDIGGYDKSYFATTDDVFKYNASKQLLKDADVANMKKGDIFIMRNSIFARHGYTFKNAPLRVFFDQQDWYMPVSTNVQEQLTDLEKKNITLLLRYEKNAKSYYDVFGRG